MINGKEKMGVFHSRASRAMPQDAGMHRTRQEEPQEQQPATYQRQLTVGCAPAIFFLLFVTSRLSQSESQLKCATAPTACSRLSLKFRKRDRADLSAVYCYKSDDSSL
jgi:hypothetical protein